LSVGFVLLGLALSVQVVAPEHGPADFFDLPLHALHGALDRFLRPALVIPHGFNLPLGDY
jgi:hypothetical protein